MPATSLTKAEATERARLLRVAGYDVALDVTRGEETFRTRTAITFSCIEPGATTFVDLIASDVREVRLNGRSLPLGDAPATGRITLPGLAADNELVVVADAVYMHSGEGLHRFVDPVDQEVYLYSQFEVADARRVFACFDQPDLKATFTFALTAPSHWQVASVSPTPTPVMSRPGTATWRFAPTPRLSTYVTALVAGPFHQVRGELASRDGRVIPLGVFCRASLADHLDAQEVLSLTTAGFAFFEALFGQPYPFAKYDQLFVPEFNAGAMENAGCVTIAETYVFRSRPAAATVERRGLTILHELAHMWFGDLVTMRWWDDLWLNESFAEWASTRCQAEVTGWRNAWTTFLSSEKAWAYRQDQLGSTHPIVADINDLADVEVNFDGITYAKGASVVKQLVHWVGQDAFEAGLRGYFRAHAWGNTTLADLLTDLEATSGRDLSAWAALWLQQAGVNTLRPLVEVADDGSLAGVTIAQEAPADHPQLRPHRLAIGCYDLVDGRLRRTHRVELDVDGAATAVPQLVGRPRPDLLLLNDDDLAYAKIRLDEHSMTTAVAQLGDFADSLPQTLVWAAAWDMTRDGEFGPRRFLDLVLTHLPSVQDPSVAQTLLGQVAATLSFYLAPGHRALVQEQVAQRLLGLLESAEPAGDRQLLLTRSLAAHARTPEQVDVLAGLLDANLTLPGLAVDTDLRWTLLIALVAAGRAGEPEIDAERDRDDTAGGRLQAARARAAIPTAQAKQRAWDSILGGASLPNTLPNTLPNALPNALPNGLSNALSKSLPNAEQSSVIRGFALVWDARLLEPFVEPYFEAIVRVWKERTSEMATQIVQGLYPAQLVDRRLLERTVRWLDTCDVEPSLSRLVAEGRDGVLRALRVQARDEQDGAQPSS